MTTKKATNKREFIAVMMYVLPFIVGVAWGMLLCLLFGSC